MKIILASAEVIDPKLKTQGVAALRKIERMARISHRSEDRQTEDSWKRFLKAVVIDHGDMSVVEHASATVIFTVNRGVTHELVRHRLFGFTQESTRFVNYTKPEYEPSYIPSVAWKVEDRAEIQEDLAKIDDLYRKWLNRGYAPQIARDFLPNALSAQVAVTGNLRNWRHAFLMRTTRETHPDFRGVMIPLLEEFKTLIPILYEDIESNARQVENMRKPR